MVRTSSQEEGDLLRMVGGSLTSANLGNNHGFTSKKYISIGLMLFGEAQNNAMRVYAQSGQYHTIVEIRNS